MSKKIIFMALTALCISLFLTVVCHAFTLLTKKQALEKIFGSGSEITVETKVLKGQKLSDIKKRLGGKLVYHQAGSESRRVAGRKKIDFHFASRNGKKIGVAIIDVEPGKWGPVEFIIALNLRGVVKVVRVMSYQEKRGRPIARRSYMNQYRGKTSKSILKVGKDIIGVSGATISSRSATFSVKKAIVLYEELYLK
jgi:Na+-translocating ferredoxin:NAD+ oxidoreductase RnfG subunit